MKKVLLLILLTPFLVWTYGQDTCNFSMDGNVWEISAPFVFDLEYLPEGTHDVKVEGLNFQLFKYITNENKKFIFREYDLDYAPEDAECFNDGNLPYTEKVKK